MTGYASNCTCTMGTIEVINVFGKGMKIRVFHGYGNTCSDQVTGTTGTGMVSISAYHGIPHTCTVVSQVCTSMVNIIFFFNFQIFFLIIFSLNSLLHCYTMMQPNVALPHLCLLPPNLSILSPPLPSHF